MRGWISRTIGEERLGAVALLPHWVFAEDADQTEYLPYPGVPARITQEQPGVVHSSDGVLPLIRGSPDQFRGDGLHPLPRRRLGPSLKQSRRVGDIP